MSADYEEGEKSLFYILVVVWKTLQIELWGNSSLQYQKSKRNIHHKKNVLFSLHILNSNACNLNLNEPRDKKIVSYIFHQVHLESSKKHDMI